MALKSPLMPSPTGGLVSAFSPYNDSPASPLPHNSAFIGHAQFKRTSGNSDSLAPPSPYPQHIEPSPVDSNGTEGTEIEEDAQDNDESEMSTSTLPAISASNSPYSEMASPRTSDAFHKIDTTVPPTDANDGPQSVIHAPINFQRFDDNGKKELASHTEDEDLVASPSNAAIIAGLRERKMSAISPVNTDVPRVIDRATPLAQTRKDLEEEWKRKSRRTSSLEDIPEAHDKDILDDQGTERGATNVPDEEEGPDTAGLVGNSSMSKAMEQSLQAADQDILALRTALAECWTLCNTLASLSSTHRLRTFKFAGRQEIQEQAWQTCWRLCQKLYESQDQDASAMQTIPTLEMCRDFCQSLFEARQRGDEASDSVLRVSFELNNHLYNTHDRTLPEAFNERTLDFYITLCHRLMKKPTSLAAETDALLRACWSLAEMLFNLRQIRRDGKPADEEILGSAVQSCWELCDLFREGWKQVRPERGTPRPSQSTFSSATSYQASSTRSDGRSSSSLSNRQYHDALAPPPETPTTIFDDESSAASSPESVTAPNILVLGPSKPTSSNGTARGSHLDRWTSNASVLSGYSESATSSQRTSSTATASTESSHLTRLRYLLLKAGMSTGYVRTSGQQLPTYVSTLSDDAFGNLPWQMKVLSLYKTLIGTDKTLQNAHAWPSRRLGASEVAQSVKWLIKRDSGWAWMRDMYRLVFGFGVDDAERHGGGFQI